MDKRHNKFIVRKGRGCFKCIVFHQKHRNVLQVCTLCPRIWKAASWEIFLGSGLSVQIGSYVYRILKIVSKTWPWCSVQGELWLRDRLFEGGLALQIHSRGCQPLHNVQVTQLSNLRWMPNSVSKGFDTAIKTGSSRPFKRYPTTYMWVSSWLPFTVD